MNFGQKVLTDVLELGMWSSSASWHAVTNEKARSKERWLLIRECNVLWVKIKRHPLVIQRQAQVSNEGKQREEKDGWSCFMAYQPL